MGELVTKSQIKITIHKDVDEYSFSFKTFPKEKVLLNIGFDTEELHWLKDIIELAIKEKG